MKLNKDKWVWLPHAGHYILGDKCVFHLCTYVNGYLVSTIGELWNDEPVRRIHAKIYDPKWYAENEDKRGDEFDHVYFKKFGWEELGIDRTYETMVFEAKRSEEKCCKYVQKSGRDLDFAGYNDAKEAYDGHMKMCRKYAKKLKPKQNGTRNI